jgi:hypothetical protein
MLESVKNQIEELTLMEANFIRIEDNSPKYSMEKIVQLNKSEILTLKFNFLIVAICKNGGLIALCKQKDYFDLTKSKINQNIIIMHQDATYRYSIPIDWNYNSRYIVSLDFNDKEQLYAFCNDGTIYKLDILTQRVVEKVVGSKYEIKQEGIWKAKLFENGYILLTDAGNIYLIEDIKNIDPQFIVSVTGQLGFSKDIDFIGIPANKSCSGKFELIITNQQGEGVLHIEKQEPRDSNQPTERRTTFQYKTKNMAGKVVKVSVLNSEKLEPYRPNRKSAVETSDYVVMELDEKLKLNEEMNYNTNNKDRIGIVTAIAISPSKDYIALYVSNSNTVFYLSSQISSKVDNKIEKLPFRIASSINANDYKEQQRILEYKTEQQLLFCGEDCVAICGGRFLMMVNRNKETIPILIEKNENKELKGYIYCKCISEVDGIRCMTDKEILLISPVPNELDQICNPFSDSTSRDLIKSYGNFVSKNPKCNDQLRKIGNRLAESINNLAKAAGHIYWTQQDPDTYNKRDVQIFLMKAAQFGKSVVQKEEFNFVKFNDICKKIRIINNMRNFSLKPRYITYGEYESMENDNPVEIINKTLRQLNFKLAYDICKFLGDDDKNVFLRYAIAKIKKIPPEGDASKENEVYNELMRTFNNIPNISYIEIAKKCIKYGKYNLAEKFLINEKSPLVKIPQYLQLRKWEKALELSLQSYNLSVIKVVIDKIYKVEEPEEFHKILSNFPQAHSAVIHYYKSIGNPKELKELNNYLVKQKDQEELLFISLEKFFKSQTLKEREECLKEAKKCLSGAKNIDTTFYKNYLFDLENSLKFKKSCFDEDKKLIEQNDISPFDNSIYDCFKKAPHDLIGWVESQNRKFFEISKRKMTILKFRALAKDKKLDEIEQIIQKEGYKKLEISPFKVATILFEVNDKDLKEKAVEYAKLENNPDLYDDRFNFLLKMEKYLDAVEAALSGKKNDRMMEYVHSVLKLKPELRPRIEELCAKYKVKL